MKNSDETIGNRTRYIPACSAVPPPTAPPAACPATRWQRSVNLYKNGKEIAIYRRRNNTQNSTPTQNTRNRKQKYKTRKQTQKQKNKHKKNIKT